MFVSLLTMSDLLMTSWRIILVVSNFETIWWTPFYQYQVFFVSIYGSVCLFLITNLLLCRSECNWPFFLYFIIEILGYYILNCIQQRKGILVGIMKHTHGHFMERKYIHTRCPQLKKLLCCLSATKSISIRPYSRADFNWSQVQLSSVKLEFPAMNETCKYLQVRM